MPSSERPKVQIPVHELQRRDLDTFDFKLYHLKGNYSLQRELSFMPGDTGIPHRHKYHEICFFSSGKGVHEIDFKKIEIRPWSIHFVAAGQVHLLTGTDQANGRVLAFSPGFLWDGPDEETSVIRRYPFINPMNNVQGLNLDEKEFQSILASVEALASDGPYWKLKSSRIIQHYIRIILDKCNYYISRGYIDQPDSNPLKDNLISRYKNLVEIHFRRKHQVLEYSQMLNITAGHLNRCCKERTGCTASEVILQRIILEAKRLLLFTNQSSKEIAYDLNFEDPSYFSRFFRSKTGYTPLRFRKLMREKYHD